MTTGIVSSSPQALLTADEFQPIFDNGDDLVLPVLPGFKVPVPKFLSDLTAAYPATRKARPYCRRKLVPGDRCGCR